MADSRHFSLNSDYPIDKIVLLKTGSIMPGGPLDYHQHGIPHGLSFTPLVSGTWRPDGSTTDYQLGDGPVRMVAAGPGQTQPVFDNVIAVADATNIYILYTSFQEAYYPVGPISYRLYGFAPDEGDTELEAEPTAALGTKFIINSGYNYRKLVKSGFADARSAQIVVNHGLGFLPSVDLWSYYSDYGGIQEITRYTDSTIRGQQEPPVTVDANNLVFKPNTQNASNRYFYRIYGDEAGVP